MGAIGRLLLLCAVTLTICKICTAVVSEETMRRCVVQTSCGSCIRADPLCVWCADVNYLNDSRCYAADSSVPDTTCPAAERQNPMGRVTDTSSDTFENLNQIVPRRVGVTARPGETVTFSVNIRPANNFPLDLYLLMDLSRSMSDDLVNLKRLGSDIAQRIKQISANFQIGFGSFVEKKVGPYVNLDPRRLIDPCHPSGCVTPYSFRQVVDLSNNSNLFEQSIDAQRISGNQDFPEGGFDGFLQSIVCTEFIGWRSVSRKLLLYISDAGFHYAGDGKLGGIVRPHDGLCKMNGVSADKDGNIDYQDWDILDYPSIGQIADKLDQFDIIPIFAVVNHFQTLYQALVNQLGDRAYLGVLASDSRNVVDLIQQLYDQISQRIVFAPPNVPGVSITVSIADCSVGRIVDGVCQEVEIGDTASFNVSVRVTECTQELIDGKEVEVRVLGFGTIVVNLTAICNCSCEAVKQTNSSGCSSKGTLTCGSCLCNRGFFGETCQCDASGLDNAGNAVSCPTGLDNKQCSGRGRCTCGICDCRTATSGNRFFGPACECDSNNCPVGTGGERCSGLSRGECTCDGCRCLTETVTGLPYTGGDCSCTPNSASCRDPSNATDVCNGKGQCVCGQCQCVNPGPYFGTYCELCSGDPVCQRGTCDLDRSNAQCARCVVELLEPFNSRDIDDTNLFDADFIDAEIMNGTLPRGTVLGSLNNMTSEVAIFLPMSFSVNCNNSCPQLVVINQTMLVDYEIMNIVSTRCQYDPLDCNYRYYVALNPENGTVLPIHVEYPPVCLTTDSVTGSSSRLAIPAWAIALILLILLLVVGILALLLLKIILLILDWIEVRKFEQELAKSKYTKNENPLYRSAQKEYKNPIYGQ